jgi:probable phosphoglycerate mutase
MLYPDIESQYGELYGRFMKNPVGNVPPSGESIETLAKRVIKAIDEIAVRHPGQKVVIVSHEIPLAAIRCHAEQKDLSHLWQYGPANVEIVRLDWPSERPGWREILWSWMTLRWWFAND